MAEPPAKFPRTPHLFVTSGRPFRGDKVLDRREAGALMRKPVVVEEKVDGANLGLSVGRDGRLRAQGRRGLLAPGGHPQFEPLWGWLARRQTTLSRLLRPGLTLFGEWCFARHTIRYDALSDWFLAFDVHDGEADCFWSSGRRGAFAREAGLQEVPRIAEGVLGRPALEKLLGRSRLGAEAMEGLYLRWEHADRLVARAKLVRPDWLVVENEHWSRRPLATNRLREDAS